MYQFEPADNALRVIEMLARQTTNFLVQFELFHTDMTLQTLICRQIIYNRNALLCDQ